MEFHTPLTSHATKIMLLGSGELGKEVAIEAQRLGIEVVAVDRYPHAPAHQVAHEAHVIDMQDGEALLDLIRRVQPDYILPEIEAIHIDALCEAEREGYRVIPNAEAVKKTMNRKLIRQFAAETLGIKTSPYRFVSDFDGLKEAAKAVGYPCVIKPIMSSSGHGQSLVKTPEALKGAWEKAKEARGDASELIVEGFVPFEYEITLLTVRNEKQTIFCEPIGHEQQEGDYIFSWQPVRMRPKARQKAIEIAKAITDGLGGRGLFGVELFIQGDEVYFSEVSPRPHDTGLVTLVTQSQSEFALHVRAVLGLPLDFSFYTPGASAAFKATQSHIAPTLFVHDELFTADTILRIFGKPRSHKGRRMAVVLSMAASEEEARKKVKERIKLISDAAYVKNPARSQPKVAKEHTSQEAQEGSWWERVKKYLWGA